MKIDFKMKALRKLFCFAAICGIPFFAEAEVKPRVIVMTDGEVDDRCSMIRFLLYTNDVELLGIVQTSSVFHHGGWSGEKWIEGQIDAYEEVYPNLVTHDPDYPHPDELRSKVFLGDEDPSHIVVDTNAPVRLPGTPPAIDTTGWTDTPGSNLIVEALLEEDERPIYIQAWGGGNTAARAFDKLKQDHPVDYDRAVAKAVMYNIWYQDGAGNYIEQEHPGVTMLLCHHFFRTWAYASQHYTYTFVEDVLLKDHGPLAAMYLQNHISEGDTPAFLYTLGNGLRGYEDPSYGGWGGRFYKVDGFDNVYRDVDDGSFNKWVENANRDFETRLKWCVTSTYEAANHRPEIQVDGPLEISVKSGEKVTLSASITDRDTLDVKQLWSTYGPLFQQTGHDLEWFKDEVKKWPPYTVSWWQYSEAGTFDGIVKIDGESSEEMSFIAPEVDSPKTIHMILEARDQGIPSLTSFARFVIAVEP